MNVVCFFCVEMFRRDAGRDEFGTAVEISRGDGSRDTVFLLPVEMLCRDGSRGATFAFVLSRCGFLLVCMADDELAGLGAGWRVAVRPSNILTHPCIVVGLWSP